MKKLILSVIGLIALLPMTAKADSPSLVITNTQGRNSTIILEEGMQGNYFNDADTNLLSLEIIKGDFTFDSAGNRIPDTSSPNPGAVLFLMPMENIRELAFKEVMTDVTTVAADSGMTVDLRSGSLLFTGVDAPFLLTVCTPDGVIKDRIRITADQTLPLEPYGSGMLIVTAGDKTFKILNR